MRVNDKTAAVVLALFFLSFCWEILAAQESTSGVPIASSDSGAAIDPTLKSALTPEFLETKIKETEALTDLDESAKSKLTELYRKALSELQAARAFEEKARAFKDALETAPARTRAILDQLASGSGRTDQEPDELPDNATVSEIEQRLAKTEADAAAVGAKLSEMEKELENSATRPAEARKAITGARLALDGLEIAVALPAQQGDPQAEAEARRWILEARRQSLRSEILMLDQELLSQSARLELLKASRDKAIADLDALKASALSLEERLNQRLKEEAAEAELQTREAQRRAADKHPVVRDLAQRNAELSNELTELTEGLNRISGLREQIEEQTSRVEELFRGARRRIEAAGLTLALGQALIDQRNQLPDLGSYRKAAAERRKETTEASLIQIRYSEEKRRLRDLDAYVANLLNDQDDDAERDGLNAELLDLAEQRRNLVDQALQAVESYLRVLGELDYASSQFIQAAEAYDGFLDERLLWVRSAQPIDRSTFLALPGAVLWAIDPGNWFDVAQVLVYELTRSPVFWFLLLVAAFLQWKTRALRRRIRETADPLRRIRTDDIRYTVTALALTLLIAVPAPLLLASLGLQLYSSLEATDFTQVIGQGAISVSLGVYFLLSFRMLCIRGGVADKHFRWEGDTIQRLRLNFDWLLAILVPLGFVASAAYNHPNDAYSGSLGRLSLILVTLGLAVFFARVLHPRRGAVSNLIADRPAGWFSRTRKLWYPLAVAIPMALAVFTVLGYVYTVGTLLGTLVSSLYLVLGITVLHQFIVRWLVLTRRRLALQAALDRRAARAMEQPKESAGSGSAPTEAEEPEEVDLASLDEQTRRLVNMLLFIGGFVAFWAIWSQVLPAFGIFEEFALWHHTGVVDGEERLVPFTLADVGLVLVIFLVAVVAGKNLPALLEILLLSRTSVSSGNRYAITTMIGYVIAAAAAITVFNALGLSWGSVQWLVAALGVGIGFGLQEIVANFISGIIILFERPVRVGDVVTIGDTTGAVTKIRIRATTIRNWDKQELLVPNKEFITGRLLNWTLSDKLNRIVLNVGVAYGSDVTLALRLLEEAVGEDGRLLEDPKPMFTFEGFGDNALNLVVRCFLGTMDDRLLVISDLHRSINEKFNAAGISIAFPQRDVHLSAAHPLDVRVHRAEDRAAAP
jgi:potassium efflux system protein